MLLPANFNPRAPCGARPGALTDIATTFYFNPRAPCGARPKAAQTAAANAQISTHAPLAGRDSGSLSISSPLPIFQPTRPLRGATSIHTGNSGIINHFNPRAPCGARPVRVQHTNFINEFQPTRPLRGATSLRVENLRRSCDFNPRAPCGARRKTTTVITSVPPISTHAPLAGRDIQ